MKTMFGRRFLPVLALVWVAAATACSSSKAPASWPLADLRKQASKSTDPALVEGWLLAELLSPSGTAKDAARARARLNQLDAHSARAHYARALDDHMHGRLRSAPEHYLRAARAAQQDTSSDESEVLAWAAIHSALDLAPNSPDLYSRWRDWVTRSLEEPRALGWRARGELVDWWAHEEKKKLQNPGEDFATEAFGCVTQLRLAGPFGHGASRDAIRSFPAELPGPWPNSWTAEPQMHVPPSQLPIERHGCFVRSKQPKLDGVFYVESYLQLDRARDLTLAVQGAMAIWVDDVKVLERDPRRWGSWLDFGTRVYLEAGRHRVLARLTQAHTSLRILQADGTPAHLEGSTDASAPYAITPPRVGPNPNPLGRFVRDGDVLPPPDDLLRLAAANLAEEEGQSDVANSLISPLLEDPKQATGIALLHAARFTERDPLFERNQTRDLMRTLQERAVERDPGLWEARLALGLWEAERSGPTDAVRSIERLSRDFPEVPGMLGALASLYQRLGWVPEYASTVDRMLERFPEDSNALLLAIGADDARGRWDQAERHVEKLRRLDPNHEIGLDRALAREDYAAALSELHRLKGRQPGREDIADRIYDVMSRAGDQNAVWAKLARILATDPTNGEARLALADRDTASGEKEALRRAIVEAVQAGAETDDLRQALDLLEGLTELEPFRQRAEDVILAFRKSGRKLPGTAARILDYSAFWVHADASSRMLEHEIVLIQSAEAIRDFAEYTPQEGLILHLRVLKENGTTLEPELVAGKPTVTFPHLEVGDCIETEILVTFGGDGQHGTSYLGPTWFFREEKLSYDRSELVVISPMTRPLVIEQRGPVPPPEVVQREGLVIRRWRVDQSPPAPNEPLRPSAREVLPNVRVGWGADRKTQLRMLQDVTSELTPLDPRLRKVAERVVQGAGPDPIRRALRAYHWVLDNVEEGEENDGRRVIMGRRGNRWRGFVELCRCLSIPVEHVVAKNRLDPPPAGPFDEAFEYGEPVLRVGPESHSVYLTLGDKYAPFGYLPAALRGASAYRLNSYPPQLTTLPDSGTGDALIVEGTGSLASDGSAKLQLVQRFSGKLAIVLRNVLAQSPEAQLRTLVETRLVGRALEGAQVESFSFEAVGDRDVPLVLNAKVKLAELARRRRGGLALSPPFAPQLQGLVSLPRRETPLVLGDSSEQHVRLALQLGPGVTVSVPVRSGQYSDGQHSVEVRDRVEGNTLTLDRRTHLPAGRVSLEQYAAFSRFVRQAADALTAQILLDCSAPTTQR